MSLRIPAILITFDVMADDARGIKSTRVRASTAAKAVKYANEWARENVCSWYPTARVELLRDGATVRVWNCKL